MNYRRCSRTAAGMELYSNPSQNFLMVDDANLIDRREQLTPVDA